MGNSAYNGHQITFNYGLADGSNGIAVANLPEPGAIGIILILASCALLRRRLARRALRD
jgi:hypothetical protein